jgi:DNA invertase Pin-like site-specific DNA recombinase
MTMPLTCDLPARRSATNWDGQRLPEKVQSWHQDRLAVVYVRQSTAQQVLEHQESTRLQYGLTTRAAELGWAEARVLVIDDDLGKSGATAEGRLGFQRLVSEVSLDHVGIIFGVEMSRLARSCKDWYQLLELCALFHTLIADLDGVYDPAQYNDRLLLGLKGTMSEAELHIMQQRLRQGLLAKARRGDLAVIPPMGYVQRDSGEVVLDPDEQVQHVIRLVFRKFAELGTVHALLRYLVRNEMQLGMRAHSGPERGTVVWRRPTRATLQDVLKHPTYAGAYVYGRRRVDPRRQRAGRPDVGRTVVGAEEWLVLLRDRLPAYISWDEYTENLARLAANRARADALGVPRDGPALLTGLGRCARCGRRLTVEYAKDDHHYAYECARMQIDYGLDRCQHVAGAPVDAFVSEQVLAALQPAALELSLEAATHLEQERADLDRLWQQRRPEGTRRAAYDADRAGRQFRLVEPENRLVARRLEREWEGKLAAQLRLEEEHHRFQETQPRGLRADERAAIRRLAADIPALWHAPTTTAADRKAILRQIVLRVVVDAQGASERVGVTIEWVGGGQTAGEVIRPVARLDQLSYYPQLCERARQLAADGLAAAGIAGRLNAEGYRPPKRRERFGAQGIVELLQRLGVVTAHSHGPPQPSFGAHEWGLRDLARSVGMPHVTLYNWVQRGWVTARREDASPHRWILWADEAELIRLRQRHQRSLSAEGHQRWCARPPASPADAPPPGPRKTASSHTPLTLDCVILSPSPETTTARET